MQCVPWHVDEGERTDEQVAQPSVRAVAGRRRVAGKLCDSACRQLPGIGHVAWPMPMFRNIDAIAGLLSRCATPGQLA